MGLALGRHGARSRGRPRTRSRSRTRRHAYATPGHAYATPGCHARRGRAVPRAPGEARLAHARDRDFARRRRRRGRAAARDARVAAGLAFRSSWVDGPGGDVDADRGVGW